ncbi:MAG: hypothetical protein COA78_15790 [Blastopirellula sp.]|nr:MAG: hypothetical protein COA78_15790 [Blastopirellula sp.]
MLPLERLKANSTLYEEGLLTDYEFVHNVIQEVLNGKLTTLSDLPTQLPHNVADDFRNTIAHLEADDYVDTYPFNRFESIEDRQKKADQFRDQYQVVFAELRAYFAKLEAG